MAHTITTYVLHDTGNTRRAAAVWNALNKGDWIAVELAAALEPDEWALLRARAALIGYVFVELDGAHRFVRRWVENDRVQSGMPGTDHYKSGYVRGVGEPVHGEPSLYVAWDGGHSTWVGSLELEPFSAKDAAYDFESRGLPRGSDLRPKE